MIHHFVHVRVQRAPDGTWLWIRGVAEAEFTDPDPAGNEAARRALLSAAGALADTRWTSGECRSALKAAREAGASYWGRGAALAADGEGA